MDARPEEGAASVHAVLPRRTQLRRKAPADYGAPFQVLAANVDVVLVATSLNRDLNARRVERFLTAAWESGARPVVVLTKVDLARDPVEVAVAEAQLEEVAAGVPVVATSAVSGAGLDAVRAFLGAGRTVVLVGSSGVGKSTLANALLGEERLPRPGDPRGRRPRPPHDRGAAARRAAGRRGARCSTRPGSASSGSGTTATGLDLAFADVAAAAESCRFTDCRHEIGAGLRRPRGGGGRDPARPTASRAGRSSSARSDSGRSRWTPWPAAPSGSAGPPSARRAPPGRRRSGAAWAAEPPEASWLRAGAGAPARPSPATAARGRSSSRAPWPGRTRSPSGRVASRVSDATIASGSPPGRSTLPQPPAKSVSPEKRIPASVRRRGRPSLPCGRACGGRRGERRRSG